MKLGLNSNSTLPVPHLDYLGGRVLGKPNFKPIYLGDYWNTSKGKDDKLYLDGFCRFLPTSKYVKSLKEYGVTSSQCSASKTVSGGSRLISDASIQSILLRELQSGKIKKASTEDIFTVFLPPGAILRSPDGSTSLDGIGGYHYSFDTEKYGRIYYAAIVYSEGQNGISFTNDPRRNISITASHEWSEAATDPDVNNGIPGWYDNNYGEVSDIGLSMGLPTPQVITTVGGYSVQRNWSNKDRKFKAKSIAK